MKPADVAFKFLEKASQDEALLDKILDENKISDEIVGFHCQQAAEKLLKALLSSRQIEFRKTHDIAELIDTLSDNGFVIPAEISDADTLTPFAVTFRYDFFQEDGYGFDRVAAREMVKKIRKWVEEILRTAVIR